jgi:enoyl-CoA hydratase
MLRVLTRPDAFRERNIDVGLRKGCDVMALRIDRPEPGIVLLTLDRPEALNSLDETLMAEMYAAVDDLGESPTDRVVVLTGEGRAFCAGQDIKNYGPSMPTIEDGSAAAFFFQQYMSRIVVRLRDLPQPVIAAVNGVAVGGGLALACAADIRLAAPTARFGTGAVRLGLSGCEMGLSYHLPRLIGTGNAAEWMLTGRVVEASEAERAGLVNRIIEGPALLDAALELAGSIVANSPFGVRLTKWVMWANADETDLVRAIDREDRSQVIACSTEDAAEAQAALIERRPAHFIGR